MSKNTATRAALAAAFVLGLAPSTIWGQKVPLCSSTATSDTCSIDDFSSPGGKAGKVGAITSGNVEVAQTSAGAVSGSRQIYLSLGTTGEAPIADEFDQSAQVQVVPSKTKGVPSALVTSYGYKAFGLVQGIYGDSEPMNLNLSEEWGVRFYFDGLAYGANFNFEVWNPGIYADCGINLPEAYTFAAGSSSFTVDFPESQYAGVDWSDITAILFEIQASGSFGITSIQAIPQSVATATPATFTCAQPAS
jgi:hypothetical protein